MAALELLHMWNRGFMRKKSALIGVGLIVAGLLAGCSDQAGSAAVVNGKYVVAEKDVDKAASEIASAGGNRTQAIAIGVTNAALTPLLKEYSSVTTTEYKEKAIANCEQLLGVPVTEDSSDILKDYCVVTSLLTDDRDFYAAASSIIETTAVEFSPRYGDLTSETQMPSFITNQNRQIPIEPVE